MKIDINKIPPMLSKGATNDLKQLKWHLCQAAAELAKARDILYMYKLFEEECGEVDNLELMTFKAYREFNTVVNLRGYKEDKQK